MTKNVYVIEDNEKNMKLFRAILNLIPEIAIFEEMRGDTGHLEFLEMLLSEQVKQGHY